MMNERVKRFSLIDLSYMEEMKSKLQKLNSVRHTTNAMIAQFDLHPKTNKRTSQLSPVDKRISNMKTPLNIDLKPEIFHSTLFNDSNLVTPHSITPSVLNSPINDEFSTLDSKQTSKKDKFHHDFHDDSHISEYSYRKYRTTHSITSSSSPSSKTSHDEPPLASDTLIIGRFYILNEIYPSLESENLNETPLAFLGSEKLLHIRIDWTKIRYPLSSYHIEIIIDLIIARPSFIREIPRVTQFNLYRPLIQIISGRLFFDHGEHKAGIHRCNRKYINHKFTINDLASIHRREFYIINYNVTREQRFINLYENLFQIHFYKTKSTS